MKGAIENCCRAEQEIMKKVREAYENDVAAMSVSAGRLSPPSSEPEPPTGLCLPCGVGMPCAVWPWSIYFAFEH